METKSEQIDQLALCLSKAQSEFPKIGKNKKGYGYNYADLESVLDAVRPVLFRNNLAITQFVESTNGTMELITMLMHVSGQYIKGHIQLLIEQKKGLGTMQNLGVAITYARRYGLQAILGISADEDTDGVSEANQKQNYRPGNAKIQFASELRKIAGENKAYWEYLKSKLSYDTNNKEEEYWVEKLQKIKSLDLNQMKLDCQ